MPSEPHNVTDYEEPTINPFDIYVNQNRDRSLLEQFKPTNLTVEINEMLEPINLFESVNLYLTVAIGLVIHIYIAFAIVKRRLLADKYVMLTYARSYNDIIYLFMAVLSHELLAYKNNQFVPTATGLSEFPEAFDDWVLSMKNITQNMQLLLIIMCIIHRFLIFTRPGWLSIAYFIFVVFAFVFCAFMGVYTKPTETMKLTVYPALILLIIILSLLAHSTLQKHFTACKYTTTVCEVQAKTSQFLIYLMLIYGLAYIVLPATVHFPEAIFVRQESTFARHMVVWGYAIRQIVLAWLPVANGLLSNWSIKDFLQVTSGQRHRASIHVASSNESTV